MMYPVKVAYLASRSTVVSGTPSSPKKKNNTERSLNKMHTNTFEGAILG